VNGDFKNDLFKPYPVPRNVEKVDFFVYNIWGELVYHSKNDINLNWSGVTGNGNELNEGVYYYAAKVKYYRRLRKQDERVNLKGWIHLIRGDGEIGK
jgi:gliding motility-associated-like protein